MTLYRSTLSSLTFDEIKDFCDRELEEGTILDYKREASSLQQVVKIVSSLANTQGGIVIFGVDTKSTTDRRPLRPILNSGMPAENDFRTRIENYCIDGINPPVVPDTGYVVHPTDTTRAYAVVHVPESDKAHTVENGTRLYVRHGDKSKPVVVEATFERELLRNRREQWRQRDEDHAKDLLGRLAPPSAGNARPFLSMRILPRFADRYPIRQSELFDVVQAFDRLRYLGRVLSSSKTYSEGIIGKHYDSRPPEGTVNNWRFALTTHGSVALANSWHVEPPRPPESLKSSVFLKWPAMAAKWAQILSEKSGFWGMYNLRIDALQCAGTTILDERDGDVRPSACVDPDIKKAYEWTARQLREGDHAPYIREVFRDLWWSFGQGDSVWTDEMIDREIARLPQPSR